MPRRIDTFIFDSIRDYIQSAGKPFSQLAQEFGVHRSTISRVASGIIKSSAKLAPEISPTPPPSVVANNSEKMYSNMVAFAEYVRNEVIAGNLPREYLSYYTQMVRAIQEPFTKTADGVYGVDKYKELKQIFLEAFSRYGVTTAPETRGLDFANTP